MTLRDALAKFETEWPIVDIDALNVVVAAARRVAEAPEVWWCEEHDNSYYSPGRCYGGRWSGGCRMVRKLLVDPDNL